MNNNIALYDGFKATVGSLSDADLSEYKTNLTTSLKTQRAIVRKINFLNFGAKVSGNQLDEIGYNGDQIVIKHETVTVDEHTKIESTKTSYSLKPELDLSLLDFWTNPKYNLESLSETEFNDLGSSMDIAKKGFKAFNKDVKTVAVFDKVKKTFKKVQHIALDRMKLDFIRAAITLRNEDEVNAARSRIERIHAMQTATKANARATLSASDSTLSTHKGALSDAVDIQRAKPCKWMYDGTLKMTPKHTSVCGWMR